jgi:hypothetical protein
MQLTRNPWAWSAIATLCLACAQTPPPPTPGTGTLFGDLHLVPREGVHMPASSGGAYQDRAMADVELVDYSKPGFAVVWLEDGAPVARGAQVTIRANEFETRLEPAWTALAAGETLELLNATPEAHTVSCPSLGVVQQIAPGESLKLKVADAGGHSLFLLDRPQVEGGVFAATGPFAVLTATGRFELRDLAPGPTKLHAWHPRFPPVARTIDIVPDEAMRVDLEMGVGRGEEGSR